MRGRTIRMPAPILCLAIIAAKIMAVFADVFVPDSLPANKTLL